VVHFSRDAAGEFYEAQVAAEGAVVERIVNGLVAGETYRFAVQAVDEVIGGMGIPVESRSGELSTPVALVVGPRPVVAPLPEEWEVFADPGVTYAAGVTVQAGDTLELATAPENATLNAAGLFEWVVPAGADGWSEVVINITRENGSTTQVRRYLLSDSSRTGAIAGHKSYDLDGDGIQDSGEPALDGWTVELIDALTGAVLMSTTTATVDIGPISERGAYRFDNLTPGTYRVREVLRPGWEATRPADLVIEVQGGAETVVDFSNRALTAAVTGVAYDDADADGLQDPGETGVSGATVFADLNRNGVLDSVTVAFLQTEPMTIADLGVIRSAKAVTGVSGRIVDARVTLNVDHSYISDLDVILYSPDGARVLLLSDVGGSGESFAGTVLDDAGATAITQGSAPFTGSFRPEFALASLAGHASNGVWTLEVTDDAAGDAGELLSWSLTLVLAEPSAVTLPDDPATPENEAGMYVLEGLQEDSYAVRIVRPPFYTVPAPAGGVHEIPVVGGDTASERNFGLVARVPLFVSAFTSSPSGFELELNRPFDPASLNLHDTDSGGFGPADVTLVGAVHGAVMGSLVVDSNADRLVFVRTGGPLAPDTYTVTLRSAGNGFQDAVDPLDGNGDGIPGDAYTASFIVSPPSGVVVSVPDFVRGAGQPVDLPATQSGIPVTLSDGTGVTLVELTLRYDPELLEVTAVVAGAALPAGALVEADLTTPGTVEITVSSATPLGSGAMELVRLTAQVPVSAPYRAGHVLDLTAVMVNSGAVDAIGDDGLHLVAFIGDTTGNGSYSALDATRLLRVAAGLDTGFAPFLQFDPMVLADTTANGQLSALDATRILQEVVGLDRPEIPPLPSGPGAITPAEEPDPEDPPQPEPQLLGALRGTVFDDADAGGSQDSGEDGLAGWTVFLDANANGLRDDGEISTVTGIGGVYTFANVAAGDYRIAEVPQKGWRQTSPLDPGTGTAGAAAESVQTLTTTASGQALALPGEFIDAPAGSGSTGINRFAEQLTGLAAFRADPRFTGIDGTGFSVVVIDTGADVDHSAFGADLDADGIADRILFQYDFGDDDSDASDRTGHGSVVSSLIASEDAVNGGVAPGAGLIILKVFSDNGSGTFAYLEQALQWTLANAGAYGVAVVNLSLGDGGNWGISASRYGIGDELAALAARDILILAAAGNNFYQSESVQGIAYPAADPAVLSAGAVWSGDFGGPWRFSSGATDLTTTADQIASFSQRHAGLTDSFAPGARLAGAGATGGSLTLQGTSQAAAYVSGAAALAQQLAVRELGRRLSFAEFATLLEESSDLIVDGDDENGNVTSTGLVFPRLNILALADRILAIADAGGAVPPPGTELPFIPSLAIHSVRLDAGQIRAGLDFGNHRLLAPVALEDVVRLDEDSGAVIDVLANDSDPDGAIDPATLAVTAPPLHGVAHVDAGSGLIRYAPAPDFHGQDRLSYSIADDSGLRAEASVLLTVNPISDPPVADAGPDSSERLWSVVRLDGTASYDPDGDGIVYHWTQTGGPRAWLAGEDTPTPVFFPLAPGRYSFTLVVGDGETRTRDFVEVTVSWFSDPGRRESAAEEFRRFLRRLAERGSQR
jgi:subtilisin-like proprotein convertase family protein